MYISSKVLESPAFLWHVPALRSTHLSSSLSQNRLEPIPNTSENLLFSHLYLDPFRHLAAGWVSIFYVPFPCLYPLAR